MKDICHMPVAGRRAAAGGKGQCCAHHGDTSCYFQTCARPFPRRVNVPEGPSAVARSMRDMAVCCWSPRKRWLPIVGNRTLHGGGGMGDMDF